MTQPVAEATHTVLRAGFANPLTLDMVVTDASFVKVYVDDDLLDEAEYSIDGLGSEDGIEITILDGEDPSWYPDAVNITASFEPPLSQPADLSAGGVFGEAFENALDAVVRLLISVSGSLERTVKAPFGVVGDMTLPSPVANATLAWNSAGTGVTNGPTIDQVAVVAGISDMIVVLGNLAAEIEALDAISVEIVSLDSINAAIVSLESIKAQIVSLESIKDEVVSLEGIKADIETLAANIAAIQAAVADLPSLAAKLNLDGSNVGDATAQAAFRAAIGADTIEDEAVRGDEDQTGKDDSWKRQARTNIGLIAEVLQAGNFAGETYLDQGDLDEFEFVEIILSGVQPSLGGALLQMRLSADNGSSFDATGYYRARGTFSHSNNAAAVGGSISAGEWIITYAGMLSSADIGGWSGTIRVFDPGVATSRTRMTSQGSNLSSTGTDFYADFSAGERVQRVDNALRLFLSTGVFTQGRYLVLGYRKV